MVSNSGMMTQTWDGKWRVGNVSYSYSNFGFLELRKGHVTNYLKTPLTNSASYIIFGNIYILYHYQKKKRVKELSCDF